MYENVECGYEIQQIKKTAFSSVSAHRWPGWTANEIKSVISREHVFSKGRAPDSLPTTLNLSDISNWSRLMANNWIRYNYIVEVWYGRLHINYLELNSAKHVYYFHIKNAIFQVFPREFLDSDILTDSKGFHMIFHRIFEAWFKNWETEKKSCYSVFKGPSTTTFLSP